MTRGVLPGKPQRFREPPASEPQKVKPQRPRQEPVADRSSKQQRKRARREKEDGSTRQPSAASQGATDAGSAQMPPNEPRPQSARRQMPLGLSRSVSQNRSMPKNHEDRTVSKTAPASAPKGAGRRAAAEAAIQQEGFNIEFSFRKAGPLMMELDKNLVVAKVSPGDDYVEIVKHVIIVTWRKYVFSR